jgi:hypothetical protein
MVFFGKAFLAPSSSSPSSSSQARRSYRLPSLPNTTNPVKD